MKYSVWFVRLVFAAWMIPAGINHFYRIFPQPLGSQPLSRELFSALVDSHLFDIVKAVELIAGVGVLTGFYFPLTLVIAMPVSFCVWYWDTPLEGWGSRASMFGSAVLLCNTLLLLAYAKTFGALFHLRPEPQSHAILNALPSRQTLILAMRVIFGAWMLVSGINYFFVSFYGMPAGSTPLATQLMTALVNSHLLDVAMGIQLVGGAFILVGVLTPLALCVVMPISVCAAYWAVILNHQPLGAALALVAVALNALLMLAYFDYYKGVLQRRALAPGETDGMNFDTMYMTPSGSSARGPFIAALVVLLAAFAFYHFLVPGLTSKWCQFVLLIPSTLLFARRLHDMGRTAWLLVVPVGLVVAGFWLNLYRPENPADTPVFWAAVVACAAFSLWGLSGKSRADAHHVVKPAE